MSHIRRKSTRAYLHCYRTFYFSVRRFLWNLWLTFGRVTEWRIDFYRKRLRGNTAAFTAGVLLSCAPTAWVVCGGPGPICGWSPGATERAGDEDDDDGWWMARETWTRLIRTRWTVPARRDQSSNRLPACYPSSSPRRPAVRVCEIE